MSLHRNTGYEWRSDADFVRCHDTLIGVFPRHQETLPPPAQPGPGLR